MPKIIMVTQTCNLCKGTGIVLIGDLKEEFKKKYEDYKYFNFPDDEKIDCPKCYGDGIVQEDMHEVE